MQAVRALKIRGQFLTSLKSRLFDASTPNVRYMYQSKAYNRGFFPYQIGSAIYNERHKKYALLLTKGKIVQYVSHVFVKIQVPFLFNRVFAKFQVEKGTPVPESARRCDLASNTDEDIYHSATQSKLEQIKKKLKEKIQERDTTPEPKRTEP